MSIQSMTMRVTVKKWGNSASVRIPAAVMEAAKVRLDQTVDVREESGRIIIEPVRAPAFELNELIAGITDENRHGEIESGPDVGNEIL
jgi:antitoxin MazE